MSSGVSGSRTGRALDCLQTTILQGMPVPSPRPWTGQIDRRDDRRPDAEVGASTNARVQNLNMSFLPAVGSPGAEICASAAGRFFTVKSGRHVRRRVGRWLFAVKCRQPGSGETTLCEPFCPAKQATMVFGVTLTSQIKNPFDSFGFSFVDWELSIERHAGITSKPVAPPAGRFHDKPRRDIGE